MNNVKIIILLLLLLKTLCAATLRNPFYYADEPEGYIEVPNEWVSEEFDEVD